MSFTSFNHFSKVTGTRKTYVLDEYLSWDIGAKDSGWQLLIKSGTHFDISVPRLLEWVLSPHDRRFLLAAAIHDELLKRGQDVAFASSELRRAAIARGSGTFFAWTVFIATLVVTSFSRGFK